MTIPVKYSKDYHLDMARYTNGTDTSYTLTFEKNNQIRILLTSRLYCRYRNYTDSAQALADFTAGRELHPALKNLLVFYNIPCPRLLVKGMDSCYNI